MRIEDFEQQGRFLSWPDIALNEKQVRVVMVRSIDRWRSYVLQVAASRCGWVNRHLIQKETPGADKESDLLPAPAGKFILMTRLYPPDENRPSILDGSWTVPPACNAAS
jgi:hypothetical protein